MFGFRAFFYPVLKNELDLSRSAKPNEAGDKRSASGVAAGVCFAAGLLGVKLSTGADFATTLKTLYKLKSARARYVKKKPEKFFL